jgi:hypothetical protein
VIISALAFLAVAGSGCFWGKSGGPAAIVGYVYEDATGEPIPGAQVVLSPTNESVVCNKDGSFRFDNLPPGKYTVRASAGGFRNAEQKGIQASPGKESWAKLFLTRVPSASEASDN